MGDQDSAVMCGPGQNLQVAEKAKARPVCCLEINLRLATQNSRDDIFIEVGVCLEAYLHGRLMLADFFGLPGFFELLVQGWI